MASHLYHADACPQTEESHLAGVHGASGGAFTQRPSYTYLREMTDKLEAKAASTLERLQSWPVYDALQAS